MKQSVPKFFLLIPAMLVLGLVVFVLSAKRTILPCGCMTDDFSGQFDEEATVATFEGQEIQLPIFAQAKSQNKVLALAAPAQRWIEVDLSEQKLKAWDGSSLFLETPVSTGLPWWPTPTGEFRIWVKMRYSKMEGGSGRYYYYLPNVPFVMYFSNDQIPSWRGYSLHGTYWHNDFGNRHSHGCVNLPTPMAERLYYWVGPTLTDGRSSVFASPQNSGTRIVIHD